LTRLDPQNREIRVSTKYLRLLPERENNILVTYWRNDGSDPITARYLLPTCSAYAKGREVLRIPDFNPPQAVLKVINQNSTRKDLNPFFVSALVAQESAFNPHAVSQVKALGLTQVTSLGESEIIKRFDSWPR